MAHVALRLGGCCEDAIEGCRVIVCELVSEGRHALLVYTSRAFAQVACKVQLCSGMNAKTNTRYIRSIYSDCALRVATPAECAEYDTSGGFNIWVEIDGGQYECYVL